MGDEWTLKVDVAELRAALEVVVAHIEARQGPTLTIPDDYFWSVPYPEIYNPEQVPQLTMGQLDESWNNLACDRVGVDENTVGFAAVWLGEILTAVGHNSLG